MPDGLFDRLLDRETDEIKLQWYLNNKKNIENVVKEVNPRARRGEVKSRIDTNEFDIQTLSGDLDSAVSSINDNIGNITDISGRLGSAIEDIDVNAGDITDIDDRLSNARSRLNTAIEDINANIGDITDIDDRLSKARSRLNTAIEDIDANIGDITDIDDRLSKARSRLNTAIEDINANIGDITDLRGILDDEILPDITDLRERLDNIPDVLSFPSCFTGNIGDLSTLYEDTGTRFSGMEEDFSNMRGEFLDISDNFGSLKDTFGSTDISGDNITNNFAMLVDEFDRLHEELGDFFDSLYSVRQTFVGDLNTLTELIDNESGLADSKKELAAGIGYSLHKIIHPDGGTVDLSDWWEGGKYEYDGGLGKAMNIFGNTTRRDNIKNALDQVGMVIDRIKDDFNNVGNSLRSVRNKTDNVSGRMSNLQARTKDISLKHNRIKDRFTNLSNCAGMLTTGEEEGIIPNPPENMSVVTSNANSIIVEWDTASELQPVEKYALYHKGPGETEYALVSKDLSMTRSLTNLSPGVHKFRVTAINSDIESNPSNIASYDVPEVPPPNPPANLSGTQSGGGVMLNWDLPETPPSYDHLNVYHSTGGDYEILTSTVDKAITFETHTDTPHHYYLTAVNDFGESEPTEELAFEEEGGPTEKPNIPNNVSAEKDAGDVFLSWDAPANVVGYYIYQKKGGGEWTKVTDTSFLYYRDKAVETEVTLQYGVSAYNYDAAGENEKESDMVTTKEMTFEAAENTPGTPSNLIAETWENNSTLDKNQILVSWDAPSIPPPITVYQISDKESGDGFAESVEVSSANTQVILDINEVMVDYNHYLKVRASNSAGYSSATSYVKVPASALQKAVGDAPTNLTLSETNIGTIDNPDEAVNLSWDAPNTDKTLVFFKVYHKVESGTWSDIIHEASTSTTHNVADANVTDSGVNHYYKVSAYYDDATESDATPEQTISVITATEPPPLE